MNFKAERINIALAGGIIGIISVALVLMGNPANMGFCLACFIRDTAGGLGLHRAEAVQYIRPEIIGLILGAMGLSMARGEFSPRGGSSPVTRFFLGFFVMIGCLMFLGCPFRMVLRLAGGLIVGALAQYTRLCMVGGFRDMILFREPKLLIGFCMIFVTALIGNLALGKFNLGFVEQPVAHNDALWNFLGMLLAGFGCCLLGGCPLRQMVMAGEGNTDSAITYLGLLVGAAFCHNFGLAASGKGPTPNGKVAVIIGLIVLFIIAAVNTFSKKESAGTERS